MKNIIKRILCVTMLTALVFSLAVFSVSAEDGVKKSDDDSFFTEMFAEVKEHSAEIFSLLTLVGSCVLAFSYKNGLMPTLKKGVGGIGGAVNDIKDYTVRTEKSVEELGRFTKEELDGLARLLGGAESTVSEIKERLSSLEDGAKRSKRLECVIEAELELLYNIFMFSSMPEYQKAAVSKKMEELKVALGEEAVTDNEQKDGI